MKDLTSKLLAEKYEAIKESESSIRLPEGFAKTRNILVETAHGAKPLKVYEIWMEGDTCKISIDVPSPAESGQPAGAPTINPQMALEEKKSTKKEPFKKNPLINKLKDKKGSFGDLGSRLG